MTLLDGTARRIAKPQANDLHESLRTYRYCWPGESFDSRWVRNRDALWRAMPETDEELSRDSRWPAMFPSPICLVTTSDGKRAALEREVGASIVNRFPYVVALSVCRTKL